jgi:WD repeat-containing protein 70
VAGPSSGPPISKPEVEPEYDPEDDESTLPPPKSLDAEENGFEEPEFPSDDDTDMPKFPITHEVILKDHTKVVSALTLDPSGARVLSGSHDYDCKLWDFGGMDLRCKPFKSWEPAETYHVRLTIRIVSWENVDSMTLTFQIHDLKYSNDGQQFIVISGTTQAKLYDRDGEEKCVYIGRIKDWIASPDWQGYLYQGRPVHQGYEAYIVGLQSSLM